jgi:hypothetical protein
MDELISRQAAIAVIENRKPLFTTLEYVEGINNGLAEAQSILKEIPAADISEQLENAYAHGYTAAEAEFRKVMGADRWIPVSEALPKEFEEILFTVGNAYTVAGYYAGIIHNKQMWKATNATFWDNEVTAWRPLPEPYKGAEE